MADSTGYRSYLRRKRLVISFALCAVSPGFSQESLSFQIIPTEEGSQDFLLTIPLQLSGGVLKWEHWELPEDLGFSSFPRINTTDPSRIELGLRALVPGRYILPPFSFSLSGRSYITSSQILEATTENGDVPASFLWNGNSQIYLGQTALYVVSLVNSTEFLFPDELRLPQLDSGIVDEVFGVVSVYSRQIGDRELLNIPIASFLFTPTQVGQTTIPSITVNMDGKNYQSDAFSVKVLPLPASVEFNGAVGQFNFIHTLDADLVSVGQSVMMRVRVEGLGNLPFINIPEPESDSVIFIEPVETVDIQATESGYKGFRELTYRLQVLETGRHRIQIANFTAVDPDTDSVYQMPGGEYFLNAVTTIPPEQSLQLSLPSAEELNQLRPRFFYSDRFLWLFLLIGPVVAFCIWKIPFRKTGVLSMIFLLMGLSEAVQIEDELVAALQQGKYAEKKEMVAALLEADPLHPGLHYLQSLIFHANKETGLAIYHLRQAVRLAPQSDFLHTQLRSSEESFGLSLQVPVHYPPPIDWVFIIGLGYWNLMWISVSILLRLRFQTAVILVGSLLAFVFFGIAGAFVRAENLLHQTEAVILYTDTTLKRIPDIDASPWISLPIGTAVEVRGVYKTFYQVTTGHGSEGWVEHDAVRYEGKFAASTFRDK